MIVSATAVLVGLMVGLVFYLQSQSDDASYLVKSKWSVTTADGTAQTWLIDSESGAISIRSVEGTTAHVQEFFGGKAYTYTTDHQLPETESVEDAGAKFCAPITHATFDGDCEVFFKEQSSTIASMTETLTGAKGLCTSEDSESISATTISSDGNLSVGGFIVSMVNGSPSAILDHAGNSMATINSFEDVEEVKLTGCDTSEEATYLDAIANVADSRRKLGEVDAEVMKAREMVNDIILMNVSGDIEAEAKRHLKEGDFSSGYSSGFNSDPRKITDCVTHDYNGQPYTKKGYRASLSTIQDTGFDGVGMSVQAVSLAVNLPQWIKQKRKNLTPSFRLYNGTQLCQGAGNKWLHRVTTKTNWCGEFSNREHTPCPKTGFWAYNSHGFDNTLRSALDIIYPKKVDASVNGLGNTIPGYDWHTDGACRRHDHGIRFEYQNGGVRLGCQIDYDLVKKGRHNLTVMAIFSERHSFACLPNWGCYNKGEKFFWHIAHSKWTRIKKFSEFIAYGPGRYTTIQHDYHYGYNRPFRHCESDYNNPFVPNYLAPSNYWWENNFDPNYEWFPKTKLGMKWNINGGYWQPGDTPSDWVPPKATQPGSSAGDAIAGPGRPGRV